MLTRMGSRGLSLRHFVPMAFVLVLLLLTVAAVSHPQSSIALAGLVATYLIADLVASIFVGIRRRLLLRIPLMLFLVSGVTCGIRCSFMGALFSRIPTYREKV